MKIFKKSNTKTFEELEKRFKNHFEKESSIKGKYLGTIII